MNDIEVVETVSEDIPAISDDKLLAIADAAEKRVEAMNKIKRAALRMTGPQDWTNQGGKPFPWASGSQKIARLFGMSWKILGEPTVDREEGGHFSYTYRGEFSLAGSAIQVIGSRSSKDPFFSKKNGTDIPPSEIDKGDVKKSAFTNLMGNGIMVMLGMKNLSWSDLESVGIKPEDVSQVQFKKGGKTDKPIASEGAQNITGAVDDLKQRTKKKDGTAMKSPLYIVKVAGAEYTSFSESFAKIAKEAKDAGRKISVTYTTNQYGNNIENLCFADDGPGAAEPAERDAGQEG